MAFSHEQVKEGVFHIHDGHNHRCTLLIGRDKAILFDTTLGLDDLRGYVASLTDLEPIVINSHFHHDHVGGNFQFPHAYMHEADIALLPIGVGRIDTLTETLHTELTGVRTSFAHPEHLSPIVPGTVFDLGGMTVEVLALPGHTPGSIGLLCREHRLLLAGDAVSPQMCLFFEESLPPEVYGETLERLRSLPFDSFLLSHFDPLLPKELLESFARCVDLIGKKRGMHYVYPILPHLHGQLYVGEARNPILGEPICIITKPEPLAE